ncbi:ferric-chelate reductase 1 [Plakobranchus ocellatus]|uniref:Ferric-chelate reductase 1 n=1 Tax=Plakobranchus ocellatus TaxID=259542 RepID=A0AAV3ZQ51_9GAST|nr:ferric-chelate reductase 1 [Plakobranchus ocellatus]
MNLPKLLQLLLPLMWWLVLSVRAYSTGAPTTACDSMTPGHPGQSEPLPGPFSLTLSKQNYIPFEVINVTINAPARSPFLGFMLQARDNETGSLIGSFLPSQGAKIICNQVLTHSSSDPKSSKTFTWRAPITGTARVQFRATVVKDYFTYYVGLRSSVLNPNIPTTAGTTRTTATTTKHPTTTAATTTKSTSSTSTAPPPPPTTTAENTTHFPQSSSASALTSDLTSRETSTKTTTALPSTSIHNPTTRPTRATVSSTRGYSPPTTSASSSPYTPPPATQFTETTIYSRPPIPLTRTTSSSLSFSQSSTSPTSASSSKITQPSSTQINTLSSTNTATATATTTLPSVTAFSSTSLSSQRPQVITTGQRSTVTFPTTSDVTSWTSTDTQTPDEARNTRFSGVDDDDDDDKNLTLYLSVGLVSGWACVIVLIYVIRHFRNRLRHKGPPVVSLA